MSCNFSLCNTSLIFKYILWKIISKFFKTGSRELKTINENQMLSQNESHIFFHVVWNAIYLRILFFSNTSNLVHDKMGIISSQIVKDDRDLEFFWVNTQFQITILVGRSFIFSSDMAMVPQKDIFIAVLLATNMAFSCLFKILLIIITHL